MRKIVAILIALACLASCQKPYAPALELAVDSETLKLPSCEAGYFYTHVASNRSWTLSVEAEKDWLHPEQTSGNGTAYSERFYAYETGKSFFA